MRTRAFLAFVVFATGLAAYAGSRAEQRVRDLEGRLGVAYLELWKESKDDAHLLEAHRLGAPGAAPAFEGALQDACRREQWQRAQALLLATAGRRSVELAAAKGSVVLRRSKKHPIHYMISLPPSWTPEKKWPVVVALEGAGCVWMNMLGPWMAARGDLPYVLVTPLTFSNTNELDRTHYDYDDAAWTQMLAKGRLGFDVPGILAVIDEVVADASGEERVFLTCFSGGGGAGWRVIFGYPEKLAGAAPVAANFSGAEKVSTWEKRGDLPIRALQGDADPVRAQLEPQRAAAERLAARSGFTVTHEVVAGARHETCAKRVVTLFEEWRHKD